MGLFTTAGRRIGSLVATVTLASVAFVPGAHAAPQEQSSVGKATIAFERTTASKCPLTFNVHGYFEGLPAGAQTVRYRLVGAEEWKTVEVPADHGAVHSTVLETLSWEWDWESGQNSVQIELDQPGGLTSNVIYYFECYQGGGPFGVAAEDIPLTSAGGPLAELVADAMLESVQAVTGADTALVSKNGMRDVLKAGPVTYDQVFNVQPAGLAVDVKAMTGAQLRKLLETPVDPRLGVLTPASSLRYTITSGKVTSLTLNGVPVSDTQVIKIAANYILSGGGFGFPKWEGAVDVARSGPDDRGALASYLANHSPVQAPAGDRVTIQ
ncbi:5'-nucleotidase C-terminal domain-containing protein [Nonomuraea sp. GTA35]|uniref:5'-nucleotidase C-terminal domain-containing protein n=1 Tax=Nonomuraea sp. GTA35 TaxID=1676746 RepID=UPI0035C08BC5